MMLTQHQDTGQRNGEGDTGEPTAAGKVIPSGGAIQADVVGREAFSRRGVRTGARRAPRQRLAGAVQPHVLRLSRPRATPSAEATTRVVPDAEARPRWAAPCVSS